MPGEIRGPESHVSGKDRPTDPCARLSPDGKLLAVRHTDEVQLYDLASGQMTYRVPAKAAEGLVFMPDGKQFLAAIGTEQVGRFDTGTGELVRTYEPKHGLGDYEKFALAGDAILSATWQHIDRTELSDGKSTEVAIDKSIIRSMTTDATGKWLLTGNLENEVSVWDVARMQIVESWKEHDLRSDGVVVWPDGNLVAVANSETIAVYSRPTGKLQWRNEDQEGRDPTFTHDGRRLVIYVIYLSGPSELLVLNAETGRTSVRSSAV